LKSSGEVRLLTAILVVALLLVGVALAPMLIHRAPPKRPAPGPKPAPKAATRELLLPPWTHLRGDPNAPHTLVVFADFQCPSCRGSMEAAKKLLAKFKGKLKYAFHHYQVVADHFNAPLLGQAAEAAAAQGKFWEMHDAIFANQQRFMSVFDVQAVTDMLAELAGEVKLDVLKFREAIVNETAKKAFERDYAIGEKLQIASTPTYFFVPAQGEIKLLSTTSDMTAWVENPKNWLSPGKQKKGKGG